MELNAGEDGERKIGTQGGKEEVSM